MINSLPALACLVLPPALLWVCLTDLLYRRISNRVVLGLLALWPGAVLGAALAAEQPAQVLIGALWAMPGAVAVLVVGFALFRLGRVGAGDVKLMAVMCLWMSAVDQLAFIIVTSLAGGLLALTLPFVGLFERMLALVWWRVSRALPGQHEMPQCLGDAPMPGIPYAPAIAIGALFTLFIPIYS